MNSLTTTLQIEPAYLDVAVHDPNSFWIFEPTRDGSGILEEYISDKKRIEEIFDSIKTLIKTSEDHNCTQYCDQCLIVPRYSYDELYHLNRRVLHYAINGF